MTSKKPVMIVLAVLLLAGLFATSNVQRVHALSQGVSLDANSINQTDVLLQATFSRATSFRVGAIVTNASTANPISSVYGWQFTINYNASAFIPQGDPSAASLYPDGAANTVNFGAQTTTGTVNWQGLINANNAFGSSTISSAGSTGQITVFITLISPAPAVNVANPTLLANVMFELLPGHQVAAYSFTISNVIFVNSAGGGISGPIAGAGVTETVTNNPPTARINPAVTHIPTGDPSCVPSTGVNCTAYAYSFDGSASTDPDVGGTIANPGGYFWDFGDGIQDLATSGPVAIHDYGAFATVPGKFNVTLRVQDNLGATGAARDSLGNVILNVQPSHTQILNFLADQLPTAAFTFTPANPTPNQVITFDASTSSDPDGTIASYSWNFGDGNTTTVATATITHAYTLANNYNVVLTVTDNTGGTGSVSHSVIVAAGAKHNTTTAVSCASPVVVGQASSCTATVTDTNASPTTPTGTVTFAETGPAGSFSSTTCALVAGPVGTANCSVTFTATATGTALITGTYGGDGTHNASPTSAAASVTVNKRNTSTAVVCTSPVLVGVASSCTATVTDTSPGTVTTPTGTVTFTETGPAGSFSSTTCALASGSCSVTFTATATGTALITGAYGGDATHNTSTSAAASVTVNPRTTSTAVVCTSPVVVGVASSCTATVTDTSAGTVTTPTGTVTFTETGPAGSFSS